MWRPPQRRERSRAAALLASAVTIALAVTLLVGSTADEEEFRFAILSAWLHVDALRHGSLGVWSPLLGLGVPQPFVPNFLLHPLLPLLALVSPVTWARVLLAAHTLLGALGMWRLSGALNMRAITRATCVATFLLATPAQNYALTDFWPSHYLVWTSAPWLLLFAWRTLEAEGRQLRVWSVALGLCVGLVTANTNVGHVIVYVLLAAAVMVTRWRQAAARWQWLLVATVIAGAVAAPNLVQLARERPLFPADVQLGLGDQATPLPAAAAVNAFVSPFGLDAGQWAFSRTLFFGGPFAGLALIGCGLFFRRHPDLVLVTIAGGVLLFTSLAPLPFVSGRFHFRDPLTLAAVLLAGLTMDRVSAGSRRAWLTSVLVVAQLAALGAAAFPALRRAWSEEARQARWFRGATGDVRAIDDLVRLAQPPGRLLFTPAVDEEVFDNRRIEEGLGVNALAYRRLPVLNGWFKGVSTDTVWPDERLFYGRISAPQALIDSPASLNVLDVRWVLAQADEHVGPGLRQAGTITLSNDERLTLYENPGAVSGGFLIDLDAGRLKPTTYAGCPNTRLLCTDLAPLATRRLSDPVVVRMRDDGVDVRIQPAASSRVLVLSQMFRRDWLARANSDVLSTMPILNGLLGVQVPPGVATIQLRYRPVSVITASAVAWLTVAGSMMTLVLLRTRPAVPDNG